MLIIAPCFDYNAWLKARNIIGLCGIDTRALTALIRQKGMPNAVIAHAPDGKFDLPALCRQAGEWPGLEGMDLAKEVSCKQPYEWDQSDWQPGVGYSKQKKAKYHVVAIDFGAKHNILRCLVSAGCRVTVVPCTTPANDILALKPDGIFLSNGPGDPPGRVRHRGATLAGSQGRDRSGSLQYASRRS